ncbi:hypothetical protein GCM10022247_65100 [Allokutzneria multivorans]|uniref:Uncharacterized protein n=2 Tax=Allokutzneria multivorans TaxID=1142134 RepID=A0ABP7TTF3_9PSEU
MPTTPPVFRGSEAVADGLVTANELRSPRFVRLFRNVYATRWAPRTHELRCRAVALFAHPASVITGASAATLRGVPLAGPDDPVDLLVPLTNRLCPVDGLTVRIAKVAEADSTPWHGVRLASPERLLHDLLRTPPLPAAVSAADACLRAGLTTVAELHRYVKPRSDHGSVHARRALDLVDPRAASPRESELRVLLNLEGLYPTPRLVVHERERPIATVALGFERERVAVVLVDEPTDDVRHRLNLLTMADWQVVIVVPGTTAAEALARIHRAVRHTSPTAPAAWGRYARSAPS